MTAVNIITSYLKKNPCYIANEEFTPKGIMVSMVGCPQPSAKVFINNWNRESYTKACPHILVDANDGKVYQTLPYCVRGKYADSDLDDQYISVLLCEPSQIKYHSGEHFSIVGDKEKALDAVDRVYNSAISVCVYLCHMFGFDPNTSIHFPAEGVNNPKEPNAFWKQFYREGSLPYTTSAFKQEVSNCFASPSGTCDHAVIEEEPAITKNVIVGVDLAEGTDCTYVNGELVPNSISMLEDSDSAGSAFSNSESAMEAISIQIDVPNLRIRKGPGIGEGCEPIGRYTGVGTFQITEIQNGSGSKKGWGKLSTGDGWVSMDFVTVL